MKIAIPTRDGRIDDHFGHCDHYTIYTIENKTVISREELPSPPRWIFLISLLEIGIAS